MSTQLGVKCPPPRWCDSLISVLHDKVINWHKYKLNKVLNWYHSDGGRSSLYYDHTKSLPNSLRAVPVKIVWGAVGGFLFVANSIACVQYQHLLWAIPATPNMFFLNCAKDFYSTKQKCSSGDICKIKFGCHGGPLLPWRQPFLIFRHQKYRIALWGCPVPTIKIGIGMFFHGAIEI